MHRVIAYLLESLQRTDFRRWQNTITKEAYSTLEFSNASGDDEVKMVTKLCEALNNKNFGQFRLYAHKIHGKRSMVEFLNGENSLVTRELADMVILSLITEGDKVVLEKFAFIQNKKEQCKGKWDIEQSQLYLLHNLPTFDGVSGIFRHEKNIALSSAQGRLGNYGLFSAPCNIAFVNARIINALQKGSVVSIDDIKKNTAFSNTVNFPYWGCFDECGHHDLYYILKHGLGHNLLGYGGIPVLGDCSIALNMHQFIRNWTQFNIGEIIIANGRTQCKALTDLSRAYKKAAGFKDLLKYSFDNSNDIGNEKGFKWIAEGIDTAVIILHCDITNK